MRGNMVINAYQRIKFGGTLVSDEAMCGRPRVTRPQLGVVYTL